MIARVYLKQKVKTNQPFDYLVPKGLKLNQYSLVEVPIQSRKTVGVIFDFLSASKLANKEIIRPLTAGQIFTTQQIKLAGLISEQFLSPLGETIFAFLPPLNKKDLIHLGAKPAKTAFRQSEKILFLGERNERLQFFCQKIAPERQNLLVLPQINQINETIQTLKKINPGLKVYPWHSQLEKKTKAQIWQKLLNGENIIVVSSRHGLLLPFTHLQTIFIDDPTNFAYHEDQLPYYNAFTVARALSQITGASLLVGDVIPDLLSYIAFKNRKIQIIRGKLQIELGFEDSWSKVSSNLQFLNEIEQALKNQKRILVIGPWKNQSRIFCLDCQHYQKCKFCQGDYFNSHTNQCVACGHSSNETCGNCQSPRLKKIGFTYEQIISELKSAFPKFESLITTDPNSAKKRIVVASGEAATLLKPIFDLAIFPHLGEMINFPYVDFRERLFRLVLSLKSNRVKKIFLFGENLQDVQFVKFLKNQNFEGFLNQELRERKKLCLPPFSRVVMAVAKEQNFEKSSSALEKFLRRMNLFESATLLEPKQGNPAAKAIIIISPNSWRHFKKIALATLQKSSAIHLEVDPVDLSA